ncbi:MAG: ketoacyl-ACP synthase III [Calditrichaeota bacterium]|nr:ketoacyl-ACP synthase III [Calditrichota bacterium]
MRNAVIVGSGMYAPERVLTNAYFNELLGEDVDTWLRENVNIYERRWCREDESTADLCVAASQKALASAGIEPDALDLIIVATDTPEYISPSTASVVQHRLGARNAGTFDINTACAGFVTALDVGSRYIRSDQSYRYILVIGAYAMSKYLDMTDKKTVTLFADGAGAVVLAAVQDKTRGFIGSHLRTEGEYHDYMGIYAGGTHQPITETVLKQKAHLLKFVRKFPPDLNVTRWTSMIQEVTSRHGFTPADVKHYFFTQINIRSIRETLDRLGLPHDRAHTIMQRYGYTGSACIPMAFADAQQQGKLMEGDLVCFMGSGGGAAFACALFRL